MVIEKQVCIVGAGISGLVAAKTFLEAGYNVSVFEKQTALGGVWEKSRTYPGLTTQNPRDTYAFSDYPMPSTYPEWPSAAQMQAYLESYAQHFGVTPKIRWQTEVIKIDRKIGADQGWVVSINCQDDDTNQTKQEIHEFDFVLICNGIFNIPHQPLLPGQEAFIAAGGKVLHSTEFNDISDIQGKRLLIVGFGKSATDIATMAVNIAAECTLIFRRISWKVPKFFLGLINVKYILLTRFAEIWIPYRHLQGVELFLHTIGKPIVRLFWWLCERILRLQFKLDACGMLPDRPLHQSLDCSGVSIAPTDFYKYVRSQKIRTVKTAIAQFIPNGANLENGQQLLADVVIFATGFRQNISFLAEKYYQLIINYQGNFHLYRHLIHPDIPQLGFVGYNSSFYCQLTSEIAAKWLVEYFQGNLVLPSPGEMHQEIIAESQWRQMQSYYNQDNGTCIAPFHLHHIEQLINDMGVKRPKKIWQRIAEIMLPVDPSAYKISGVAE
ncbi:NAD(P)/FAD-dependent oxidoreductase [Nostoc sp. TCL26-01]|uniref:flavin-containing monooxygenase n=1 Tax=Nostoc sp. TCL26-01 TaxID=2576904 RepID=UPI0015BDA83E|nr:NAD(P)-binding domain-containing protein [Nostoc sp. TCL26-01]QLE56434.1 K+ transport protein [Nostoc sp. TCL26-01]